MTTPTVSELEYRPHLKLANSLARGAEWLGLPVGRIDADSILASARRSLNLEDLGDQRFLVAMRHVVDNVADHSEFTPLARVILRQAWILAVQNRLRLQDWITRHPEVLDTRVHRPIFVLGFPRTGTTVLQNLLSLDPRRRGLHFWEITLPAPVHEDRDVDRERRRRQTNLMIRAAYAMAPEMARVHYIDVDTLEECWPLFGNSFAVMNWDLQSGLNVLGDWLMNEWDMTVPYGEYRRTLQVLLERRPADQLVLKCPEHLFFVDALLSVFPDACIVQTHRDPYDTIGSYCSLMSLQWRNLYGQIDRQVIGRYMEQRLHTGVQRAMAARQGSDPSRFFDVQFQELVADPAAVVDRIAAHFDLPLRDDHREQVQGYLANKREDDRGKHKYDPDDYGLDRDEVHERYSDYIERFGIQCS